MRHMRPQDADSARWRRGILSAHCGDGDKWKVLFEARSGERMADKMTTWKTTYISAVVHQAGDNPIINDHSTTVTICDEAGGAFISLTDSEGVTIKLDPDEFEIVANVARGMLECFNSKHQEDHCIDEVPPGENYVTPFAATCELLSVINRDGGQHTGEVGTVQSCKDAEPVVRQLMSDIDLAISHAQIVNCLFRYIDRMNDVCDEDPADTILREFVADVMPFINDRISKRAEYETRKT